ncbi:hypothetical protein ALO94_200631 [Pseudomonas syringae pv. spinaceae]|uniref:Uncharacterized protein n=1 Tax=Pseudomonas syringae pv. spinaceae TaxID=264459 RepID=A0A0P9ZDM4_PSESX|nr:hypothetical protein ALO94_200631 [Pseudomonas syringae pv. spinaceae]
MAAADIRKVADCNFRHAQPAALGHHAQVGPLNQSHAAAQHQTVHEGQHGFAVAVYGQVQLVFFSKEGLMQILAVLMAFIQ